MYAPLNFSCKLSSLEGPTTWSQSLGGYHFEISKFDG